VTRPRPLPVIIDTDPGVDDALALLLAGASPELEVLAITTVGGNVSVDRATENARRIVPLAWQGRPFPPIYRGLQRPCEDSSHVFGEDGLGGAAASYEPTARVLDGDAASAIAALAEASPGEVTLITLGPLTNAAAALALRPGLPLREIVVMGGAFREAGNVTPAAEYNIYVDPEAAQAVCGSEVPQRWIPLDATHRCLLRRSDLDGLPDTPSTRFCREALAFHFDFHHRGYGEWGCFLHDPLAVGAVIWPELLPTTPLRVGVETEGGMTRGMTLADLRPEAYRTGPPPNARVCLEVDGGEFERRFIERLGSGAGNADGADGTRVHADSDRSEGPRPS
jgi:inosine-uridine nucleoside N-ribohydrolase